MSRWFLFLGFVFVGVLAASCTGNGGSAGDLPPSEVTTGAVALDAPEPVARFEARWFDWKEQAEQFVARCMAEAGFEYVPELPNPRERDQAESGALSVEPVGPQRLVPPADPKDLDRTRQTLEKIGYGVFFGEEAIMAAAPREVDSEVEQVGAKATDPNRDYVLSLGDAERAAYWLALFGDPAADDPSPGSCWGRVPAEVGPPPEREGVDPGRFREAEDRILGLVAADPRMLEAEGRFRSCVADHGYGFEVYDEAYTYVDRLAAREVRRLESEGVDLEPLAVSGDWSVVLPPDRLAELRHEEVAVAVTSWDCYVQEIVHVRDEVTADIEGRILEEEYPDVAVDLGLREAADR